MRDQLTDFARRGAAAQKAIDELEGKRARARRQLIEAEASAVHALAAARTLITELEEENRQLRETVARREDEIYTEEEFAALFKVSESTMQRLRRAGKISPFWLGTLPRYSRAEHFERAAELFGSKKRGALKGVA